MRFSPDELTLARSSPAGLGHVVTGGLRGATRPYVPFAHLRLINDALLRAVDEQDRVLAGESAGGEWDRLMVFMPPRHGKSETTSKYAPAWFQGVRPERKAMLTSYESSFAESWGRKARDLLEEHGEQLFGVRVSQNSAAAKQWELEGHQGGMVTAGVGGPITGKGGHLVVIDDPVKNAEDAQSEVKREKQKDWWRSTLRTRLERGAIVVLVMTRWHKDDLAGWLLAQDRDQDADLREGWRVISLPALAEADGDALGRAPGEPLCPQLGYDARWAKRTRAAVGSYWWAALYRQQPTAPEGVMFKRRDFRYYRVEHDHVGAIERRWFVLAGEDSERRVDAGYCSYFQTCDAAISAKDTADYTVVATWALTPQRDLLLVDLERRHFEDQQVAAFMGRCADKHGRPPMWVERFGAGRNPLRRLAADGYPVLEMPEEAGTKLDKVTRAFGAVSMYERHAVFHPAALPQWLTADEGFEDELVSFPNASHDDQVDVTSYAARLVPIVGGRQQAQSLEPPGPKPQTAGIMSRQF